jgi:hypothetical protein
MDASPYADWSAHLFTADRTQYIIVTNTASLYSAVMYGRGVTDDCILIQRIGSFLREVMDDDGLKFLYRRFVAPSFARVSLSNALNRAVIGSMNDLVRQAKCYLIENDLSPYDTSFRLNETPMSMIDYAFPKEAFKRLSPVSKKNSTTN